MNIKAKIVKDTIVKDTSIKDTIVKDTSIKDINREIVINDYQSAKHKNQELFMLGDINSTSEYIYDNQKEDATIIVNKFYETTIRTISIVKRTKVGMDGLMVEIAKNMSTHPDDDFMIHRNNIFFITAMSNISWENNMKDKIPACFSENVFHHGKLQKLSLKLKNIKNAIIINDEIDSGDKEDQKLHSILKKSGVLDIHYMEENNIRFVFVSATIINELKDLGTWGEDKHYTHYMSIPPEYISHKDFLDMGIIQEYYPVEDDISAEKWIQEDILQNYENDFRIHIIRTDEKNKKYILNACRKNGIEFKNHTSSDRISTESFSKIFDNITNHLVIAVKGLYRRANLIPNDWKKKIGAMHEKYVKKYDTNVQVQGLVGRMTGYWKNNILSGHKTGPYRTSINAINEYEAFYANPYGEVIYNTTRKVLFTNPKHIKNLEIAPKIEHKQIPIIISVQANDIIFTSKDKSEKLEYIKNKLNCEEHNRLYQFILHATCIQITKPISDNSYKKHITDVVNSNIANRPCTIDLTKEHKKYNNWQVFIDDREKRLCFVLWSISGDF
jgi:hypothetical protein